MRRCPAAHPRRQFLGSKRSDAGPPLINGSPVSRAGGAHNSPAGGVGGEKSPVSSGARADKARHPIAAGANPRAPACKAIRPEVTQRAATEKIIGRLMRLSGVSGDAARRRSGGFLTRMPGLDPGPGGSEPSGRRSIAGGQLVNWMIKFR